MSGRAECCAATIFRSDQEAKIPFSFLSTELTIRIYPTVESGWWRQDKKSSGIERMNEENFA
jgi:hypothetical protein